MTSDWNDLISPVQDSTEMKLSDGSRVGVIGGGPAGSFFSYFLLDLAGHLDLALNVDIFEPRDFSLPAPQGCNMCGGIISESMVQNLATEGIKLPSTIIQRGIGSYHLYTDCGSVVIQTPVKEMRIASVYRGAGPRDIKESKWGSFDGYLQKLAVQLGANVIRQRVNKVSWVDDRPQIEVRKQPRRQYDLIVVATGVNGIGERLIKELDIPYEAPKTTKTFIREYFLGEEAVREYLGSSMHVFLLDIPRLEFAAIIPKGDYVSICLLGEDIDSELMQAFLDSKEVRECLPVDFPFDRLSCKCSPRINIAAARKPYANRLVFIGDCASTRLYKDGIGGAYRAAKAAAATAVLHGVSADDFKRHYRPTCQNITSDNNIGKLMFIITRQIQKRRFAKLAMLRMTQYEQLQEGRQRRMSMILWDMFTGSSPYTDVFMRTLAPGFWALYLWYSATSLLSRNSVD